MRVSCVPSRMGVVCAHADGADRAISASPDVTERVCLRVVFIVGSSMLLVAQMSVVTQYNASHHWDVCGPRRLPSSRHRRPFPLAFQRFLFRPVEAQPSEEGTFG